MAFAMEIKKEENNRVDFSIWYEDDLLENSFVHRFIARSCLWTRFKRSYDNLILNIEKLV